MEEEKMGVLIHLYFRKFGENGTECVLAARLPELPAKPMPRLSVADYFNNCTGTVFIFFF
jgi:hypothetical protein